MSKLQKFLIFGRFVYHAVQIKASYEAIGLIIISFSCDIFTDLQTNVLQIKESNQHIFFLLSLFKSK